MRREGEAPLPCGCRAVRREPQDRREAPCRRGEKRSQAEGSALELTKVVSIEKGATRTRRAPFLEINVFLFQAFVVNRETNLKLEFPLSSDKNNTLPLDDQPGRLL